MKKKHIIVLIAGAAAGFFLSKTWKGTTGTGYGLKIYVNGVNLGVPAGTPAIVVP
jgi:hypothetical protein